MKSLVLALTIACSTSVMADTPLSYKACDSLARESSKGVFTSAAIIGELNYRNIYNANTDRYLRNVVHDVHIATDALCGEDDDKMTLEALSAKHTEICHSECDSEKINSNMKEKASRFSKDSKAETEKASLVCKSFCDKGLERFEFFKKGIELGAKKSNSQDCSGAVASSGRGIGTKDFSLEKDSKDISSTVKKASEK